MLILEALLIIKLSFHNSTIVLLIVLHDKYRDDNNNFPNIFTLQKYVIGVKLKIRKYKHSELLKRYNLLIVFSKQFNSFH